MSRIAAKEGFREFLDTAMKETVKEFSVQHALRGTGLGPQGMIIDKLRNNAEVLEQRIVEPEIEEYRDQALQQFSILLDYAESEQDIDKFKHELITQGNFSSLIKDDISDEKRTEIINDILDRNRMLGDKIKPIIDEPEDDFWRATQAAYDREEATRLVEQTFPYTKPLRQHKDAVTFKVEIKPENIIGSLFGAGIPDLEIVYTDEAIRAMHRAEQVTISETKHKIRDQFD